MRVIATVLTEGVRDSGGIRPLAIGKSFIKCDASKWPVLNYMAASRPVVLGIPTWLY